MAVASPGIRHQQICNADILTVPNPKVNSFSLKRIPYKTNKNKTVIINSVLIPSGNTCLFVGLVH